MWRCSKLRDGVLKMLVSASLSRPPFRMKPFAVLSNDLDGIYCFG
jgi:hypothetical protein